MEQGFIDILKQLVKEQGNAALTDAKKCKALLADYTKNEYKKESRRIIEAVEAGIAKAVEGADDLVACKKAKIRELEEEYDLKPEAAADIVNTLALVLRGDKTVTASPSAEKPAAGKEAVKKPALKTAAKKPATVKPAVKKAATKKLAALKPAVKKPAAKKTASQIYDKALADYNAGRYDKAVPVLKELAETGHSGAQNLFGFSYLNGKGLPQDYAEAAEWFRKAAEQGDAEAQASLGWCYIYGKGVPQDSAKAFEWCRKAAEQGLRSGQNNLAHCYEFGIGVTRDIAKAAELYRKAAAKGHKMAKENLARLEERSNPFGTSGG
jgi:hypothetical protein